VDTESISHHAGAPCAEHAHEDAYMNIQIAKIMKDAEETEYLQSI
jgi:hypothetical protein